MRPLLFSFVFLLASPSSGHEGRRLALIVGVQHFDDESWTSLRYAQKDALDVAKALDHFDRRLVLADDASPTLAQVRAGLRELVAANSSSDDTVVIYLSTHGTLVRNERGELERVLLMRDSEQQRLLSTALRYDELMRSLEALRSQKKLVVLAACHAGAGKSVLSPALASELRQLKGAFFAEPRETRDEGRIVLSASAWGEPAREDDGLENDIYTHFFVEALRTFDRNGDGVTTALEAHDYARERTITHTRGRQRPTLTAEIVGGDPIVLRGVRGRRGRPTIGAYGPRFDGARLFIDGYEKGVLPGGYIVEPGVRRVLVFRPEAESPLLERELDMSDEPVWLDPLLSDSARTEIEVGVAVPIIPFTNVGASYLPPYVMPRVGVGRRVAAPVSVFVALGGTYARQAIQIESGNDDAVKRPQELLMGELHLALRYFAYEREATRVETNLVTSYVLGTRRVLADTIVDRRQLISFGSLGLELAAMVALIPSLSLRGAVTVDGVALWVDERLRLAPRVTPQLSLTHPW